MMDANRVEDFEDRHEADVEQDAETVITLTTEDTGERLDKWLAVQLPERSRAEVQRWIEDGRVTRGEKTLKSSYRVGAGETISVSVPAPLDYNVEPEAIPLDVVYEDADLLVINKPAGMVVHPALGNWHGTLVNAVLYHCPALEGVGGTNRPGIVHRLDKDTSGLILVAKNDRAHRSLQEQFRARTVQKTYLALVYGQVAPQAGEIQAPIGRDPHQRKHMAVVPEALGRPAATRYEVISYYNTSGQHGRPPTKLTLLACHPLTGRTHQIRVHMTYLKHPLVGDQVYGFYRHPPLHCPRQFLHAARVSFRLPSFGEEVTFEAPLPADLQAVMDGLEPN
jgi:23S rRNA pseudouridine1911/1915/1917 synthase